MNSDQIKYLLIAILGVGLAFVLFKGNSSVKKAKTLEKSLRAQVDSLAEISKDYKKLQTEYKNVVKELVDTKAGVVDMKDKLASISAENISSATTIRRMLLKLLDKHDSLDYFHEIDTTGLEDLKFD